MPCPGSINLSRSIPEEERSGGTNIYAREGQRAHALGELCLRKGVDADFFVGMSIEGEKIDETMADFVQIYVDYCRRYLNDPTYICWIEHKFNLGSLNPPGPMFGTADFCAYDTVNHCLIVVDLKYGSGVIVEVRGNKQTRYYALGAALTDELRGKTIKTVKMTIVQPRVSHPDGVIRSEEIEYSELLDFTSDLLEAARATTLPNAPLVPGAHCRFCPAGARCPARAAQAVAIAQQEFDVVTTQDAKMVALPDASALTDDQLVQILERLPILEGWAASIRAHAEGKLRRGEPVAGFKMVAKRATRKWTDEEAATAALKARGIAPEQYLKEPELKSPAQIEKVLGKKKFNAEMSEHVVKQSSGYVMAPEHDPRPAVALTAGEEFPLLESGEDRQENEKP